MPAQQEIKSMGLEEAIRRMSAAVVIAEAPSGKVIFRNWHAMEIERRLLDEPVPEIVGNGYKLFHPDGRPYETKDWPILRSIRSGERIIDEEYYNILPDGTRLTVRCSSYPLHDSEGGVVAAVAIAHDITERKRAEAELEFHARLFDSIEDAVLATDQDFLITAWNKGAEELYGWTADEVLGHDGRQFARTRRDEKQRSPAHQELVETGRTRSELRVSRKDGTTLHVDVLSVAIQEHGKLTGYVSIQRDITERKRAEGQLRNYARFLENAEDAVIAVNDEFVVTTWNRGAEAAYGWTAAEALGREAKEVVRLQMSDAERDAMWRQTAEDGRTRLEAVAHRKDGTPFHVELINVAVSGDDDEIVGYLGIHRDITDRRLAEEELTYNAHLIDSVVDAVVATDATPTITAWNKGAESMYGWPAEEVLGLEPRHLFQWEVSEEQLTDARQELAENSQWRADLIAHRKDGTPFNVDLIVVAMRGEQDEITGYLGIHRDITARKRAEKEREVRARQQEAVAELGVRALANSGSRQLMDDSVALVARILEVEYAGITELLPGGDDLLLLAGVGWREGSVGVATDLAGRGSMVGYTLLVGQPVVSEDVKADERFTVSELVRSHNTKSGLSVVIGGRDAPFGVLGAFSTEPRSFSPDDVNFLQAVANVLATAVERSRVETSFREVREKERQRIARDLHDDALRDLADALAEAHRAQQSASPEAVPALERLLPALKRVGQDLRGAIYNLRLGGETRRFSELLESLVALHRDRAVEVAIHLDVRNGVPAGPLGATGTEVIRILGEALTNARRHSGANNISVGVWVSQGNLFAEVADDGRGFDPEREVLVSEAAGLKGMRERASFIEANLTIKSHPGEGTKVRLELPLDGNQEQPVDTVRVLLVEDHVAVREALAASFDGEVGFEVAGQAASLAEARRLLEGIDVAVVDLGLPDGFGADLIRELRELNPHAQALVLSASLDRGEIARAVESGAAGILNKTVHLDEVVEAVRRLSAGDTLMPFTEVVELLRHAGVVKEREEETRKTLSRLTSRENEVLQALTLGLDSQGVADHLRISLRTERNHISSILAKLGVHSQLQALVLALRSGIVKINAEPPERS